MFPLIAVARKLTEICQSGYKSGEEVPCPEFLFVGPSDFSKSVFRKDGIKSRVILTGKVRRYFSLLNIVDFFKLPIGFFQAYWHMFWFMPDVIFAKGGYGSMLVAFVGFLFRIPIVVHESDIVPGITNKFLAKISRKVIVSFADTAPFFDKSKTVVIGNPIREELFSKIPDNPRETLGIRSDKPMVFIVGGSQGANQINDLVLLALSDLVKKYEIIHQCGARNFKRMQKGAFVQLKNREDRMLYHLYPMLSEGEMSSAYSLANVVISRAGSGAIFEIAAAGKPSILIPYEAGSGEHQIKNAEFYKDTGATHILSGRNIMPHMLVSSIDSIVANPEKAQAMSEAATSFAKPNAAQKIAEEILKIAT